MIILFLLGLLMAILVLWAAQNGKEHSAEDVRRIELTEERDQLIQQIKELHDPKIIAKEKVKLAQLVSELDELPHAPQVTSQISSRWALLLLLSVSAVVVLGSFTVFPQWRLAGLPTHEANQLQQSLALPRLAAQAEKTKSLPDLLAWGDAAWEAKQYREAAQAYTQVLAQERTHPKAMRRAGFYLLTTEMAKNGFILMAQSATLAPNDAEGQLLYGYALGVVQRYEEGLTALKRYQKLAPESHEADELILEYQTQLGTQLDGQLIYTQHCAACHGSQLQGGTGPRLLGSLALKQKAALQTIVLNGAAGMPAFPQLKGAQLEALTEYLMKQH